jgi:hypothetical protein
MTFEHRDQVIDRQRIAAAQISGHEGDLVCLLQDRHRVLDRARGFTCAAPGHQHPLAHSRERALIGHGDQGMPALDQYALEEVVGLRPQTPAARRRVADHQQVMGPRFPHQSRLLGAGRPTPLVRQLPFRRLLTKGLLER